MIGPTFFARDATVVAKELLGKVVRHRYQNVWLAVQIIETEAYYMKEKGSHASLGRTPSRKALFSSPGTLYMYYARGGDSLNISVKGEGDAVLIKSAIPYFDRESPRGQCLPLMQKLNPIGECIRPPKKLCSGQTLLCKAINLKVPDWNNKMPIRSRLRIEDVGIDMSKLIQCRRLGIPAGRDEHLMLRFIDASKVERCTQNPLTKKTYREGRDYFFLPQTFSKN